MNKVRVNELIPQAYEVLKTVGIANEKGEIIKSFRSQVSSFGASVTTGNLFASIAFFSDDEKGDIKRSLILKAILKLLDKENKYNSLFQYAYAFKDTSLREQQELKENIIEASVAIKLAMNLYSLIDPPKKKGAARAEKENGNG